MCLIGVLLGQIGTDVNSGLQALHAGLALPRGRRRPREHRAGLLRHRRDHQEPRHRNERTPFNGKIKLMPTWPEFKRIIPSACAAARSARSWASCPAAARPSRSSRLRHRQEGQQVQARDRHGCIEGVAGQAAADEPPRARASSR
jgi:hypothetical protein